MAEHDGQRQFLGVVVVQRGFEHHARFARRQRDQKYRVGQPRMDQLSRSG